MILLRRRLGERFSSKNQAAWIRPLARQRHNEKPKTKTPPPEAGSGVVCMTSFEEETSVLGRPGSDLLSQGLSHSTIGAEEFNGRVRDGIGFKLLAETTRPAKDKDTKQA